MKKIALIILAVMLVFAVACKQEPADKGNGSKMPVEKSAGQDRLIEQGSKARAVDHTGFSIKLTAVDGEEETKIWLGGKDGIYWVGAYDEEESKYDVQFFYEDGNKTKLYVGMGVWMDAPIQGLKDCLFTIVDALLYQTYTPAFKDFLVAGSDETVDGRACATYRFNMKVDQESAYIKFCVDKEYGCTIKADYKYTNGKDVEGTSFSLAGSKFSNVTAGDLPEGFPVD
ncbi:MAG: hypothetical protein MJ057_07845 [Sphaerochaetaceae bacterium]|nr:hypothetical protein [Sphaerochaetaceae bacterium]